MAVIVGVLVTRDLAYTKASEGVEFVRSQFKLRSITSNGVIVGWLPRRDVPSSLPPPSRPLNPSFQTVVNLEPSSFKISNRSQGLKLPNPSQARNPCCYQARQPQAINPPSSALALPRYKPQDASNTPLEEYRKYLTSQALPWIPSIGDDF
jgi:hypothetical protein